MRWMAFLLLGANLLFLGFRVVSPPRHASVQEGPPRFEWSGLSRLNRIVEQRSDGQLSPRKAIDHAGLPQGMDAGPNVTTNGTAFVASSLPRQLNCFAMSFPDEQAALEAKAVLEAAGIGVGVPHPEHVERIRYWVLLPPYRSDEQARVAVERLKRAGLKDYYLIPNGENKNALSLGVFSSRESAQRRINDAASLNLKVRVEEVNFPSHRYVIELRAAAGQPPPNWQQSLPLGVELDAKVCDQ